MSELVFIVEEEADGGFVAHAVGESIVTQADTREELTAMVRDAVKCHFDRPQDAPSQVRLQLFGK
jgi:predicted RNase H-like HicB family nuclease